MLEEIANQRKYLKQMMEVFDIAQNLSCGIDWGSSVGCGGTGPGKSCLSFCFCFF